MRDPLSLQGFLVPSPEHGSPFISPILPQQPHRRLAWAVVAIAIIFVREPRHAIGETVFLVEDSG